MTDATRQIITTAITSDPLATAAERTAVLAALSGRDRIVSYKEAAERLDYRSHKSITRLVNAGKLVKRRHGVTESSLNALILG